MLVKKINNYEKFNNKKRDTPMDKPLGYLKLVH